MATIDEVELAELRAAAAGAQEAQAQAAADLRAALLEANPDLPGELVGGATAAELRASVENARGIVEAVRERALDDVRQLAAARSMGFRPPPPAGDRTPAGPPEGTRGIARIAFALSNPGPGATE